MRLPRVNEWGQAHVGRIWIEGEPKVSRTFCPVLSVNVTDRRSLLE